MLSSERKSIDLWPGRFCSVRCGVLILLTVFHPVKGRFWCDFRWKLGSVFPKLTAERNCCEQNALFRGVNSLQVGRLEFGCEKTSLAEHPRTCFQEFVEEELTQN